MRLLAGWAAGAPARVPLLIAVRPPPPHHHDPRWIPLTPAMPTSALQPRPVSLRRMPTRTLQRALPRRRRSPLSCPPFLPERRPQRTLWAKPVRLQRQALSCLGPRSTLYISSPQLYPLIRFLQPQRPLPTHRALRLTAHVHARAHAHAARAGCTPIPAHRQTRWAHRRLEYTMPLRPTR